MTILLPPDIESSIQAAVHKGRFASLDDAMTEAASLLVQQLKQEQAQVTAATASSPTHKPIWEVAAELRKSVPADEWDKLPVDGAEHHDHYIYGTPKRPPSP